MGGDMDLRATFYCLFERLPYRVHFRDFKMIDDACLLSQIQCQTLTAGGLRYLPNDIPRSSIYEDFSDALVNQYFHLTPAVF
jgi:hypothetical protein